MKFRKKPVVVEAMRWTGDNTTEVENWADEVLHTRPSVHPRRGLEMIIETPDGPLVASRGDWIIKGVEGELYPCKPDIFDQTYEAVP